MANITNAALYNQLLSYQIDEPTVALPFEKRLARENGWNLDFSRRVIEEYKRFVYLCMTADHPCTPSDEVDQAWHLHMLYTSSYFDRLCGEILGKTIAHEPTKGGSEEGEKFHDWYSKTLESYSEQFGEAPPTDIWPSHEIRFGNAPHFRRINVNENIILSKKQVRNGGLGLAGIATALFAIGCSAQGSDSSSADSQMLFIVLGIVFFIAIVIWINRKNGPGSGCSSGGGCSTFSGCGGDSGGSGCSSGCGGGCGGCGS